MKLIVLFLLAFYLAFEKHAVRVPSGGCGAGAEWDLCRKPGAWELRMSPEPQEGGCSCLDGDKPAILPAFCQGVGQSESGQVQVKQSWD